MSDNDTGVTTGEAKETPVRDNGNYWDVPAETAETALEKNGETGETAAVKELPSTVQPTIAPGEVLIRAEHLVKIYHGRRVVSDVSLTCRAGEVVGLLGPNGAGKTTSFYMVMGLIRPDGGDISFRGVDITHMPMYKRARMGMGYLAQEPSIFRKLTVEENIMAILETLAISSAERKRRCAELLDELELTRLKKQKAMTLSGGERRRLEITRALVTNPSFIMLDEPFSGVDPLAVYDVQQIILQLKSRNLGILITDHNVRDTLRVVDRAYLMCMGKIMLEGSSDFLVNDEQARTLYLGPQFSM